MTGPENYAEAEKLIRQLSPDIAKHAPNVLLLKAAQVHATLACAAAYAEVSPTSLWHDVAGKAAS